MSSKVRVGFCASGNGYLARAAVVHRRQLGIDPVLVAGEATTSPELETFCREQGVRFERIQGRTRQEFDERIAAKCIEADLGLMTLTFNKILPAHLVSHYEHRIINMHPALLPAFKGFRGFADSVGSGSRFCGATLHEVVTAVDEGPIIAQTVIGLRHGETADSVGRRLFGPLRQMYLQVISWYVEGRVEYTDQGRIVVRGAVYGEFPTSPSIEQAFPD